MKKREIKTLYMLNSKNKSIREKEMSANIDIPKALEHFRKEMKYSQREFASKGKVSNSYYNDVIKYRRNPTVSKIDEFCRNVGIPFHILIYQATIETIDGVSAKSLVMEKLNPLVSEFTRQLNIAFGMQQDTETSMSFEKYEISDN